MSVDFTNKKKEKSNYDYLKEALVGNAEGLEFLEGFKDEKQKEIDHLRDEVTAKENEIDERDTTITEMNEKAEYSDVINTRLGSAGDIKWQVDNLAAKSMMEELDGAISRGLSLLKIENILRAL